MNLRQIYSSCNSVLHSTLPNAVQEDLAFIGEKCFKQKGVYTVLVTLLYYKHLHPEQDVRIHQANQEGGFSGRSFDTEFVTPVLKELGLPSMSESGWLTRSLEQPYPYNMNYNGKISGGCKMPFLRSLDYLEKHPKQALEMLKYLLCKVKQTTKSNEVVIIPLEHKDVLTIDSIVAALDEHFNRHYGTHNGAKLPVLAFYAIYKSIIKEMSRYAGCELAPLGSLTACDKTSKVSGDIEIYKDEAVFESVEIKLDRKINKQVVRVVEEKIYKHSPERYYILSYKGIEEDEHIEIQEIIDKVGKTHGCQIIVNGLLGTIKYCLRLISDLSNFITDYSACIQQDKELQKVHKDAWNEILGKMNAKG